MFTKRYVFLVAVLPVVWLWIVLITVGLGCQTLQDSVLPTPLSESAGKGESTANCAQNVGKIVFMSNMNDVPGANPYEIYVMDADGGNLVRVTDDTYFDTMPAWSPDHCKIVFSSKRAMDTDEDLYVINADGTELTRLTSDPGDEGMPDWSPDGKRIAYTTNISPDMVRNYLAVMNVDGSRQLILTKNLEWARDPEWSPEGDKIVFECGSPVGEETESNGICIIDPDGSNLARLTPINKPNFMFPTWSPDGKKIALVSNLSGQLEIYKINPDGSGLQQLTSFGPWEPVFLNWSSDGQKILMELRSGFFGEPYAVYDVAILYLEDMRVENLTNPRYKWDAYDRYPDW